MSGAKGPVRNPFWTVRTGRLLMSPVGPEDLPTLTALKSDPRVFALMQGGVRSAARAARELEEEIAAWARLGYGAWLAREHDCATARGYVALQDRADGRGTALRFAFGDGVQGPIQVRGLSWEAAAAALRYGLATARLRRVVAVARETNHASRVLLGGIGMVPVESFDQLGQRMVLYESVSTPSPAWTSPRS